jgi:membrane-bound ClpP family serine protease
MKHIHNEKFYGAMLIILALVLLPTEACGASFIIGALGLAPFIPFHYVDEDE